MRVKLFYPGLEMTVLTRDAVVVGLGVGERVGIPGRDVNTPMMAALPREGESVFVSPNEKLYPSPFKVFRVEHHFDYENGGGEQVVHLIMH